MKVYQATNFSDVYKAALTDLSKTPQFINAPRGLKIKENLKVSLLIEDPTSSLYLNSRRSSQFKYIAGETLWYFLGRNDIEFISKYASFWKQIANSDNTANSAYGNLIFNTKNQHGYSQYEWALKSLISDKDSRQAVMFFNNPKFQYDGNKDFVCTLSATFFIREDKLYMDLDMRSNDAILGLPTDVAFFSMLMIQLKNHLLQYYPNLTLGTYSHNVKSFHIYERHFELVKDMLHSDFQSLRLPELDIDLINVDGTPTQKFLDFVESQENTSNSVFLNWLKNNL